MKRNPRSLRWTKPFRKAAGKELTVDSTLAFAARRNVPVRYNRDLVATTLRAMQRVTEIKQRRERAFYRRRMAGNKEKRQEADRKLVTENQHLLPITERDGHEQTQKQEVVLKGVVGEDMEIEGQKQIQDQRIKVQSPKIKTKLAAKKKKQRLLVGQGPEPMDVGS